MKISERVTLLKAGYTREEIKEMIAEENAHVEQMEPTPVIQSAVVDSEECVDPAPKPTAEPMYPDWARGLIESVDALKSTIEATNRAAIEQPPEVSSEDKAAASIIEAYSRSTT